MPNAFANMKGTSKGIQTASIQSVSGESLGTLFSSTKDKTIHHRNAMTKVSITTFQYDHSGECTAGIQVFQHHIFHHSNSEPQRIPQKLQHQYDWVNFTTSALGMMPVFKGNWISVYAMSDLIAWLVFEQARMWSDTHLM
jgi:hypothetical protein